MSASLDRRALLAAERGTLHKEAETRIALVYPSPYRAAMSSLGYQQIYRVLHAMPGVAADRAMLPDEGGRDRSFVTLEQGRPVGGYPMLAYSVAYELEIAGVVETLERASVPVLAADRDGDDVADYMVTWYPTESTVASATRYTVDFWQAEHRGHDDTPRWHRLRQDIVSWCNS